MTDGYTMLITWPEFYDGEHAQEIWYAHLTGQTEAVRAVQNASGAVNDAKIEILGTMEHRDLIAHGVPEGEVKQGEPSHLLRGRK